MKVKVSSIMRGATNGQEVLEIQANTPAEAVQNLIKGYPATRKWLYDKKGSLRAQVWLFAGGRRVSADELNDPVKPGEELQILLAISGG